MHSAAGSSVHVVRPPHAAPAADVRSLFQQRQHDKVVGLAPDSAAPEKTSNGYAGTSPVNIVKCRGVFIVICPER